MKLVSPIAIVVLMGRLSECSDKITLRDFQARKNERWTIMKNAPYRGGSYSSCFFDTKPNIFETPKMQKQIVALHNTAMSDYKAYMNPKSGLKGVHKLGDQHDIELQMSLLEDRMAWVNMRQREGVYTLRPWRTYWSRSAIISGESVFLTDGNNKNFGIQDGHIWEIKSGRGSWERWYICVADIDRDDKRIRNGDTVYLRNDACPNHNLGVNEHGELFMSNDTDIWQKFIVKKRVNVGINKYASAEGNDVIYDYDDIYFASLHGQHQLGEWKEHIGVDPTGKFWTGEQMGSWEKFTVSKEYDGIYESKF